MPFASSWSFPFTALIFITLTPCKFTLVDTLIVPMLVLPMPGAMAAPEPTTRLPLIAPGLLPPPVKVWPLVNVNVPSLRPETSRVAPELILMLVLELIVAVPDNTKVPPLTTVPPP